MSTVHVTKNQLIEGNPLAPESFDMIAQLGHLPVGERVPEGWRVLTGNQFSSLVARVVYRFEVEE